MPKIINVKTGNYKESLPDKEMEMILTEEELKKFYEAFPQFAAMRTPIDAGWEEANIQVTMKITAFKKKSNGS